MDPQTVLSRVTLLVLFLNLLLPGGHCRPLSSPGQASELSGIQELLDHLQDKVPETPAKQAALEPLQQDPVPTEAWEAGKAAPKGIPGPRDNALQSLRGLRTTKIMRDSGCFGQKLDRIGSFSRLGCNVLRRH
ncbi:natriuretic peptides B [Sciurus carolinensis]|uniref:natriuretic peptides B n=1 Tax=Sciurus carolinensis TaxID=30640 RepID=UPI001FB2DC39|nr:natriuretic peptides B [Sciurus carolinensis]